MYLVDLDNLSNGMGKSVYGGRLDAYSFTNISCETWFDSFTHEILKAIGNEYLPIYRIADGELRFLFGSKINLRNKPIRSILSYLKYEVLKRPWRTSWGEEYNPNDLQVLKSTLIKCVCEISKKGRLAIYWNENGLNAFTEYNRSMTSLFKKINVELNQENYVPFHFGQAIVSNQLAKLIFNKNVLFISGLSSIEYNELKRQLSIFRAKSIELFQCSSKNALNEDYTKISLKINPDIVFVAAGIGAAKILFDLEYLNCPIIDIGSYIHVLSGKNKIAHAGFFVGPNL